MKKLFLSIAIALAVFSTAFANAPALANDRALASFQRDFEKASEVSWSSTSRFIRAKFQINKEVMFAYYDFDGNLVGLVHHMLTSELPSDLQSDLKKYYTNYWVSELFQVKSDQGTYYYIQMKNADETLVLTTEGTNSWHIYGLTKKPA